MYALSFPLFPATHNRIRAENMPRWAGLNHFNDYINENFMDGSKWEDMSKVLTYRSFLRIS